MAKKLKNLYFGDKVKFNSLILFILFLTLPENSENKNTMSSNSDYGRKGAIFGKIVLTIILFIIMLIWIYNKNGHFVPVQ